MMVYSIEQIMTYGKLTQEEQWELDTEPLIISGVPHGIIRVRKRMPMTGQWMYRDILLDGTSRTIDPEEHE